MTSEPAAPSLVASPLAAIALKVAGAIAILSALLDFIILLVPPNLVNTQWQLATTTQFVDRGIVPLVGMALLLTGFWLDNSVGRVAQRKTLTTDLRFWVCTLASLLGLLYLLLTLLHLNAVRLSSQQALDQVNNEASEAASQLQQRLSTELSQQQTQLGALLQDEDLLAQAIQSGQLPPDIEQYRDDPAGLTEFLQQRASQAQQQIETEIGTRRTEAERRVKIEARKSAFRISVISLLLAAGYSTIGWLGLRRLLSLTRTA
ncbi:MAG TPA: HpsJ family protein [Nodosilinea sp.]|nr:HpsJ family protein [Nodosilinea sp.]